MGRAKRRLLPDCEHGQRGACPAIQDYVRSMMVTRPSATAVQLAEIAH
jgi:hypothetical protein